MWQQLRKGRDLVGRQESYPEEVLGELYKLTFWGLDAYVSTNTSPQFSQDLQRPWWVWRG